MTMDETQVAPSVTFQSVPYEDSSSYEELSVLDFAKPEPESTPGPARPSLADRIGNTKVYLVSDTIASKLGKRKHEVENDNEVREDEVSDVEDVDMEDDPSFRQNAILLRGSPISSLPTSNIFAYSSHFDAHPIGLEWIDDSTCILVFDSKATAVAAHRRLQKSNDEEADIDGFTTSKPIPVAVWPPQQRISDSLGKGEGLRGIVRMRWARKDDVKEKGARKKSQFYKKHGSTAGWDTHEDTSPLSKRRRAGESDALAKAQLDDEIDTFIAEDDGTVGPPSPPSKMRSAHMDESGRSLLERTSIIRLHHGSQRDVRALSHRDIDIQSLQGQNRRGRRRGQAGGNTSAVHRPHKTQQELDDELDAFLNEKD